MLGRHPDPRSSVSAVRSALVRSHRRLVDLADTLSGGDLRRMSYCRDWTVAQVLSHLGSGAEIATAVLRAVAVGAEPPGREEYRAIWDRWDAAAPEEQRDQARAADAELVTLLGELSESRPDLVVPSFRGPVDLDGYAATRLGEHAVHVWDIDVVFDPDARIDEETAAIILSSMAPMVGRLASGTAAAEIPATALAVVGTTEPWRLTVGPETSLDTGHAADPDGTLHASDEALLRLVYGRLDPDTTPPGVSVDGPVSLDDLRRLFPGF